MLHNGNEYSIMKKYILDTTKYTFSASAKTITFIESYTIQNILVITNVENGEVIYNFACPGKTGTLNGKVLTLDSSTSGMSDTDELLVILQEEDASIENLEDIKAELKSIKLESNSVLEQLVITNNLLKLILS